ncbi:patatin-like phospholipase domain-containing protein 2 isoform X1 [Protopterus annectens]|uniref:patatin-like phospholipase domain-containing protein 2 isoform X1 n=1 Tax=Protopterus annectens TaxID=7888 RepID=UPI001CFBBEE3|nr:patatin-like phospholipase domain-containing protein 2 isoform X1 [Protopterus annectens]XP_043932549.1 patatin-like phospholipase domain-containing protein 2 isoform X1 [Protopterus annectens]XP_043932550.1 patatin-like phospholipase domain-containing protein 2 isoform X1 [Protopterus annectens]
MAVKAAGVKGTHPALSFSGSGFLAIYQLGVVRGLLDLAPDIVKSAPKVFGASAGSLTAAAVVCGVVGDLEKSILSSALKARKSFLGPFHPASNISKIIQQYLCSKLPQNAHEVASGKLHIAVTRLSDGTNILLSEFNSRDELIQAIICSCFVPVYCGLTPPTFRGVRYIDGGFTCMQPYYDINSTITVSPFTGEHDICPRDCFFSLYHICFAKSSFLITPVNLHRIAFALFPPETKALKDFACRGYQDAIKFLQKNGLLEQSSLSANGSCSNAYLCVTADEASPRTLSSPDGQNVKKAKFKADSSQQHQLRQKASNQYINRIITEEQLQHILAWIQKVPSLCRFVCDEDALKERYNIHPPYHSPLHLLLSNILPQNSEESFSRRLVLWAHQLPTVVMWIVSQIAKLGQLKERRK